jgi:hypothetical protein
MLEKKELEVADLRQVIETRDVQLQRMNALAPSLSQLRKQLADLEAENRSVAPPLSLSLSHPFPSHDPLIL